MRNIDSRTGILDFVARGDSLAGNNHAVLGRRLAFAVLSVLWLAFTVAPLHGRAHKKKEEYGLSFSTEIAAPESEVLEAVQAVVEDGIIKGSFEYNKDKYIGQASSAESSPLFPQWSDPGRVFYKVRTKVLAPANFKETADEGTLAVRYVVRSRDAGRTILKIDAVFAEDFRRTVHVSNGSVEGAEYSDIQDHVDALELQKTQNQQSERQRQEELARRALARKSEEDEAAALATAQTSVQGLEQHVQDLRRQAERVIKAPGAQLKSAPFHTASNLKSLDAGTEVVIIVATPYWYGVETEDGQHGWIHHEQLEPLP
ncbi:MAG TPA: SH3 domain-containing protein [Terriglobales bacterium]|nr:SH3 domain-containing protein [Terriglobales bacterium]